MLTFQKFSGINNVLPPERLVPGRTTPLATATDIDIGLDGELRRRAGYSEVLDTCHKNLWQADGFMLATVDGGDLVAIAPNGDRTTIYPSLGVARVWYCNLPDGRTAFSNGLICGLTDGATYTTWGVPLPAGVGEATDVAGSLFPGKYTYLLTHVRLSDGMEGGAEASLPVDLTGGIVLTGLPVLAGHKLNVYLTQHNGDVGFFAGSTTTAAFAFTGANDALVMPLRTDDLGPAPAGIAPALWRSRVLTAVGPVLYASLPNRWELFDPRRDFKQFGADITLVQPVDGGIWVGTTEELAFLAGDQFDKLTYERKVSGRTVLGSGVAVRGELVRQGEGAGQGAAMVCIADGVITAGFSDGGVVRMTEGVYTTTATEVAATFRMVDRIPQYIAIPQ